MPVDVSTSWDVYRVPMTASGETHTDVFPLPSSILLKLNRRNIANRFVDSSSDALPNSINRLTLSLGDISAYSPPPAILCPRPDENTENHVFRLSSSCLLKLNKGSITNWFVDGRSDAIVNSTNTLMFAAGGADFAIHKAAGPRLRDACYAIPEVKPGVRCPTGEARITLGYELPASRVIHTVGPVYFYDRTPAASLRNAYRNSLKLAIANKIHYIAFPAVCCGTYGYPMEEAAMMAISTVREFADHFKEVHFVLLMDDVYNVWLEKTSECLLHIMQNYCCPAVQNYCCCLQFMQNCCCSLPLM